MDNIADKNSVDLRVGADRQPAMLDLVTAVRVAINATRTPNAPIEALQEAAALIERATDLIKDYPDLGPLQQTGFATANGDMNFDASAIEVGQAFPFSPVVGLLNPIAPPVTLNRVPTENPEFPWALTGTMTLPSQYTGPPETVHGGVVALLLDEMLGACAMVNQTAGMTGTLSIRYSSPTPINAEIELEAHIERTERRKVYVVGTLHHQGNLTARAEGIFIRMQGLDIQAG